MNGGNPIDRWFRRRTVPWLPPDVGPGDGPIGIGGRLDVPTLVRAYSEGVFPWFSQGDPVMWWSPDPRGIFELDRIHVSHRLARTIRSGKFSVTVNRCFFDVVRECGEERDEGTWITDEMLEAYTALHRDGHAHSLEVWHEDKLAGGIYGVTVGGLFAGESMFHRVTDASKVALVKLCERLRERGFILFDSQMVTPHTAAMGAIEIPRSEYLRHVREAIELKGISFV